MLRLFFAINFDPHAKDAIQEIVELIRPYSRQGRFVDKENVHLTLEFLGEIEEEKVASLIKLLNTMNDEKFTLNLKGLDDFKTRRGKIYWLGIEENKQLLELQHTLHQKLAAKGFELGARKFLPHITIGRKQKLKQDFNEDKINETINQITFAVDKIDLMESKLVEGKLVYSVVASHHLN